MSDRPKHLLAALCLVVAVVAFRLLPIYGSDGVVSATLNLAPLAALAICGGMLLPRRLAAGVTLGALVISDVLLNLHYGKPVLNVMSMVLLVVYAGLFAVGFASRARASLPTALLGTTGGVLLFYVVTNTVAFFASQGTAWSYPPSFAGWVQSQTVGLPQYPPQAWVFGLRMLASNLVFAAAFYFAIRPVASPSQSAPAPAAA